MKTYDAVVVGGGPSGLQTARVLAERGLRVGLFEEKSEIGADVICTGIVGRETFHEFEISDESRIRDLRAMTIVGPSGRSLVYEHPSAFAEIVDRRRFDKTIAAAARAAGADIVTNARVVSAAVTAKGVRVRFGADRDRDACTASVLVLATGVRHRLQGELGLGAPTSFLSGVQCEVDVGGDVPPSVYVGTEIAPGAFGWAVPATAGRTKIGLITEREPRRYFRNFLNVLKFNAAASHAEVKVKPIAQGLVSRTSAARVLVVGEAAGQVKTTTGGGIYYGLLGARVASDIVLKAFRTGTFDAAFFSEYDRLWRAVLKREILVGHYVRKLFGALNDGQIERLMDVARQDGVIPLIRAKGHFDWQSGLIVDLLRKAPVFRLIRELGRPPAFLKKFWA